MSRGRAGGRRLALATGLLLLLGAVGPAGGPPDDELERLQRDLLGLVEGYPYGAPRWSVLVVSVDAGDTLFSHRPDALLAPASNAKLLTTAAALERLGPRYRFRTYLLTRGRVRDGVLEGDLVIYGTGDPGVGDRLYPTKNHVFHRLVDRLEALGVREVRGDLVGDASFLPGPLRPDGWDRKDLNDHFAPGVSALSFNENVVSFRVAASRPGLRPEVQTIPDQGALDIRNNALTVAGSPRPRLAILRQAPLDPVRIEGRIRSGSRDVWRQMTVPDPARFALSVFRRVLEDRGIALAGRERVVRTRSASVLPSGKVVAPALQEGPRTRVLAAHASPPLSEYLEVVNKRSNNLFAELIFRTLGRVSEGVGTEAASRRAVLETLAELEVDTTGVVQADGSGLSGLNRVSAGTLVGLLERMVRRPAGRTYRESLPEAGRRRELGRMYRTAAAGNLQAKTGTIEDVSALSGYVRTEDGEQLAFSVLVNEARSVLSAKRIEDRLGVRLASFTRGPGAAIPERIAATLPPPPDTAGPERHRVAPGESFSVIARRYGLTLDELLSANPRIEPRRLQAGQWLVIPGGGRP